MRLIQLGTLWTVVADCLAWLAIHLGAAFLLARLPSETFDPENWLCRSRGREQGGSLYRTHFKIGKWKHHLPDAAPLMGSRGFPKKRLRGRSPAYLASFLTETCRAETVHWVIILFAPLFFLWNPLWVGFLMVFYALAENLPLIMAQRYNRSRLRRILKREVPSIYG